MTVKEALRIIDMACSEYKGSRSEHIEIGKAIKLIQDEIQNKNSTEVPQD